MKATGIKPPPLEQGASSLPDVMMRVEMWGVSKARFAFFFIYLFYFFALTLAAALSYAGLAASNPSDSGALFSDPLFLISKCEN